MLSSTATCNTCKRYWFSIEYQLIWKAQSSVILRKTQHISASLLWLQGLFLSETSVFLVKSSSYCGSPAPLSYQFLHCSSKLCMKMRSSMLNLFTNTRALVGLLQVVTSHHVDLSFKVFNAHVFNLQLLRGWNVAAVFTVQYSLSPFLMIYPHVY